MVRDRQPASKATTFADRQLDKAEKWRTVPKCDLRPRSWGLPVHHSLSSMHELSILFCSGLRDIAKKPFHERHLTKSGFGKPKAAKLDNPSDAVLRERGARRRSWGTKAKPLACNPPTALLSARAMPARRFPPPWSAEEQDACYVVG